MVSWLVGWMTNWMSRFQKKKQVYDDLDHLAGTWTPEEASEFQAHLEVQRSVNAEMGS